MRPYFLALLTVVATSVSAAPVSLGRPATTDVLARRSNPSNSETEKQARDHLSIPGATSDAQKLANKPRALSDDDDDWYNRDGPKGGYQALDNQATRESSALELPGHPVPELGATSVPPSVATDTTRGSSAPKLPEDASRKSPLVANDATRGPSALKLPEDVFRKWGGKSVPPSVANDATRGSSALKLPEKPVRKWGATSVLPSVATDATRGSSALKLPEKPVRKWGATSVLPSVATDATQESSALKPPEDASRKWAGKSVPPSVANDATRGSSALKLPEDAFQKWGGKSVPPSVANDAARGSSALKLAGNPVRKWGATSVRPSAATDATRESSAPAQPVPESSATRMPPSIATDVEKLVAKGVASTGVLPPPLSIPGGTSLAGALRWVPKRPDGDDDDWFFKDGPIRGYPPSNKKAIQESSAPQLPEHPVPELGATSEPLSVVTDVEKLVAKEVRNKSLLLPLP